MEFLWILLIVFLIAAAVSMFGRGAPVRRETVIRRRPRRARRVIERETIEPTADGRERRVIEREAAPRDPGI